MRHYNVQANCHGSGRSGHASGNKSSATFRPLDQVGIKPLRSAVVSGCMNDTWIWGKLEFECVEAEGQPLSYGFQSRFLMAPVLEESPLAWQAAYPFNNLCLGLRKVPSSELYRLQVPRTIFEVDADPVCRRPSPEKTKPAGGKTKPEIRQIREVGTPFICLLENDPRQWPRRSQYEGAAVATKRSSLFELCFAVFCYKAIRPLQLGI